MLLLALLLQVSATRSWGDCVMATAAKWSVQKEAADIIADGALDACPTEEARMTDEIRTRYPASDNDVHQIVDEVKARNKGRVIARVLKVRQR